MKKIVLSAIGMLICLATSYSLQLSNMRACTHPVYTAGGSFTGCYATGPLLCAPSSSVGSYYTVDGVRILIPPGQLLKCCCGVK